MSDLTPEDRALLDQAREGHEPTDSDRRRVRALLVAQIGVGAGLISSSTGASAGGVGGAVATGSTLVMVGKGLAAVALVGTLAGGAVAGYRAAFHPRARAAVVAGPAPATVAMNAPLETPARIEPAAPVDVGSSAPDSRSPLAANPIATHGRALGAPTAVAARAPTAPALGGEGAPMTLPAGQARTESETARASSTLFAPSTGASAPDPVAPELASSSPPTPTTLEAETALVRGAISALHAGDPGAALRLLDEHRQRFPDGVLSLERDTERVAALCALGRATEGRSAAEAFLAVHPAGALAARVRSACAAPGRSNP